METEIQEVDIEKLLEEIRKDQERRMEKKNKDFYIFLGCIHEVPYTKFKRG